MPELLLANRPATGAGVDAGWTLRSFQRTPHALSMTRPNASRLPSIVIACALHAGLIVLASPSGTTVAPAPADVAAPLVVVSLPPPEIPAPAKPEPAPPEPTPASLAQPAAFSPPPPPPPEAAAETPPEPVPAAPPPIVEASRQQDDIPATATPAPPAPDSADPEPVLDAGPSAASVPPPPLAQSAVTPHAAPARKLPIPPRPHIERSVSAPAAVVPPKETAPRETTLPPTPNAEANAAPAREPAAASGGSAAEASFEGRLLQAVQAEARRNYPAAARLMGITGRVTVGFTYRDGVVHVTGVTQSSGTASLDRAALAAVQNASYPPPPAELAGHTLVKIVHVKFELNAD